MDCHILYPHLDGIVVSKPNPMNVVDMETNNLALKRCVEVGIQETVANMCTMAVNPLVSHVNGGVDYSDASETLGYKVGFNAFKLAPITNVHPPNSGYVVENAMDTCNVAKDNFVSPTNIPISDTHDVSLNLAACVINVEDHLNVQGKIFTPANGSSYYEFSSMEPIINITVSPLSNDDLDSIGREKQIMNSFSDGNPLIILAGYLICWV
ncbi:hypothetical protein IEQ34_021659 [Dendrobium chrysotoxum]|uniref:Uncharacterized protein n=1 Tax=Dendrobium chrysotoxum TaxID=161865 RepID=A0AAV7G5D2_DENCH|nr:hypothetical protein IEQ34_021659 [Dendrobium chrysotoxum]